MSTHDSTHTDPASPAEAVFLEFVARDEPGDFDELCARHPQLADELRALRADWVWIEDQHDAQTVRLAAGAPDSAARYEMRGEIGRGGMGVVYEVWDRELRRRLAVKVSRALAGGQAHYRFLEEAQVTAQLDHPGVVPIHELGIDREGRAYFSMREVQGQTLAEVFERARRGADGWNRTRALGVLVQVCETLAFAHERGVVHRDLKPSNVMVGRFGEVYVMDWGLAKVRDPEGAAVRPRRANESWPAGVTSVRRDAADATPGSPLATLEGSVLGTPAYMPPEQAGGRTDDLGAPGDVYAVGAILYHLLAGEPPYAREDDVVAAVRRGPPAPLDRAGRDVPPELAAISDKAMARATTERYAGMMELAADLRAFLENRVVSAHQTGPLVEMRKWVARNRALATALGAVLALLVAALFLQRRQVAQLERAGRETAFENYVANVAMAAQKLEQSDVLAARRHLEACPSELRNWEWIYQWERCDESALVLPGAGGHQVAFHPSEPWLASASWDGLVWVFDTTGGEIVAQLDGGGTHTMGVDFSADGRWLLSAGASIRAWDTRTWELEREYENDSIARDLSFEPGGGPRFATAHLDGTLRVWSLASTAAERVFPIHDVFAWSAAWSPDGGRLASTAADGTVSVTDARTGETSLRFRARRTESDWHGSWELAFDSAGERLVNGQPDGALTVWDASTGELLQVLRGHAAQVSQVRFLDDSKLVSASHDRSGAIWDLADGRRLRHLRGHEGVLNGLAVHPGGASLATCSADGTLRIWNLDEAGRPLVLSTEDGTAHARLSPDGSRVVAGGRGVKVWDARTGERLLRLDTGRSLGAFSAGGDELYVTTRGSHAVRVFDARSGQPRPPFEDEGAPIQHTLTVDRRGRWLASGAEDRLTLWDVETRAMLGAVPGRLMAAFDPVRDRIAFGNPEGQIVIATCPDLAVERVLDAGARLVWEVAFDPAGELLAAGTDAGWVRLFDARTGAHLRDVHAHPVNVFSLTFSPDGKRLATGSDDKTVKLWDVATSKEVLTLTGPHAMVDQVRFSPDGRVLIASANDSKVRVWRTAAGPGDIEAAERLAMRALSEASTQAQATEALRALPDLPAQRREAALRIVSRAGPLHLRANETNWRAVETPGRPRAEYARAVESQRRVCAAFPLHGAYLNTLGIGLLRLGEHGEALAILERADRLNRPPARRYHPVADRAYIAICLFELGERERALALLEELRAQAGEPGFLARALNEAEARCSR